MTDRATRIQAATTSWVSSLLGIGGRGSLVRADDPRAPTLDLTAADPGALEALFAGRPVRLRSLVRDSAGHAAALRRVRAARDGARQFAEEHGIPAGRLAIGAASWTNPSGEARHGVPILLRQLWITARTASEDDFALELGGPALLNPLLLAELRCAYSAYDLALEPADATEAGGPGEPTALYDRLRRAAAPVPAFTVTHRLLLGTFTDAAPRLADDLRTASDLLQAHDVVAGLSGDPGALAAVRVPLQPDCSAPDRLSPTEEFLILDADAMQSAVIGAVVAGRHVAVEGPPGTGRSQTVANLVTSAVAAGERVLVIAAKRAAVDTLLRRLDTAGLPGIAVDAAEENAAERIADAVAGAAYALPPEPELDTVELAMVESRQLLAAHNTAMHAERAPWGMSVYAAQAALLALPAPAATRVRFGGDVLAALHSDALSEMESCVREWAALGGTTLTAMDTPWFGARAGTTAEAEKAQRLAATLASQTYPAAAAALERTLTEVGLTPAAVVTDWRRALDLLRAVQDTERLLSPEVWTAPLADLVAATADAGWRREHDDRLGWQDRMAARRAARKLWRGERTAGLELHDALVRARAHRAEWAGRAIGDGVPRGVRDLGVVERRYAELLDGLAELALYLPDRQLPGLAPAVLHKTLRQLATDPVLLRLPRLGELSARCSALGLRPLLVDLHTRRVSADLAPAALSHAWLSSVLAAVAASDPAYGSCDGVALRAAVNVFGRADVEHLASTGRRLQRVLGERLATAVARSPDQASAIRAGVPPPGPAGLRALLDLAPQVTLTAAPCWVLSPWVVPDVLPAVRLFDVVVVMDAHQLPVPVAAPALARGAVTIAVGDRRQLPVVGFGVDLASPSSVRSDVDAAGDEAPLRREGRGEASLLDALAPILPDVALRTSYRLADERLVAFAAATAYAGRLSTTPSAMRTDPITHILVPHLTGAPGQQESVTAEVQKVVGLVLDHAVRQPEESFGVVTLGAVHAERIAAALRVALVGRPELGDVFRADAAERFFVKPCAHVQGDVRDMIVFATGLGKTPDGRLPYRFGPLDAAGGERLLTTGLTRARRRLTVVTSFASDDMDPGRLRSAGPRLLRALLRYVESSELRRTPYAEPPTPDGLDLDLRHRLRAAGLPVSAELGVGPHRIAVALAHPADLARMVLAVETDGPRAAALPTVRDRERLARDQLVGLGWSVHKIFAAEWFRDPDGQIRAVRAAYDAAVDAGRSSRQPSSIS